MKQRITILVIAIITFLFFNSCWEEKPVEPGPPPTPEPGEVIIPSTTKNVTNNDYNNFLVSLSTDSTTFTFSSGFTTKFNPEVGDVLVISDGGGLLRKIAGVQTSGNEVIITTRQATLTDAIAQGKIVFRYTLNKSNIESIVYLAEGVTFNLEKGDDANFNFDINHVLYDADGNENTTDDQVKMVGYFTITAEIIFDVDIKFPFILDYVILGLEAFTEESLELIADVQYNIEKQESISIMEFPRIPILLGGGFANMVYTSTKCEYWYKWIYRGAINNRYSK